MKDYSKFIPSLFGFITKYEIVGEEIYVYTTETKKGEPHKYPLEWLSHIEKRLENQYQLIIENRDIVKTTTQRNLINKIYPICCILTALSATGTIILLILNSWWIIAAFAGIFLPFLVGQSIISNKLENFDREIDIAATYINTRSDMEELRKTDSNVTAYLSKSATKRLNRQDELIQIGTLDNALNIDFMDKTSLKDLKQLLQRYMISKALLEEQKFVLPLLEEQKSQPKKKTRKKDNK